MKNRNPIFSVVRVMPTFATIAVVGCLIGRYAFHESLDRLAVDVAVPMIANFLITRILVLFVPRDTGASNPSPTPPQNVMWVLRGAALLIFLGTMIGSTLLLSSSLYYAVGFEVAAHTALRWAQYCLAEAVVVFSIFVGATFIAMVPIRERIQLLQRKLEQTFWRALHAPTQIAYVLVKDHSRNILQAR